MCCIASEQTLANLLPLRSLPWRKLVIYASQNLQKKAERLQRLAAKYSLDAGAKSESVCEIVHMPKALDWASLRAFAVKQAQGKATHGRIDFNLTGGTKLMTMAFADAFKSQARLLYCATDTGTLEIMDAVSQEPVPLAPDMLNVREYLDAQGFQVTRSLRTQNAKHVPQIKRREVLTAALVLSSKNLSNIGWNASGREAALADNANALKHAAALRTPANNLLGLFHILGSEAVSQRHRDGNLRTPFRPFVFISHAPSDGPWRDAFDALKSSGIVEKLRFFKDSNGTSCMDFCFKGEEQAAYLGGGYLEEYVFLAMSGTALPVPHFDQGVGIGLQGESSDASGNVSELNELDAVAVWRNRLLIVECKAGVNLFGAESQSIINKLDQLKDNVGGTMGNGWLVTQRRLNPKEHESVLTRARQNRIRVLDGQDKLKHLGAHIAEELGCDNTNPWPTPEVLAAMPNFKTTTVAPKPAG
jgi:hypothetical protein